MGVVWVTTKVELAHRKLTGLKNRINLLCAFTELPSLPSKKKQTKILLLLWLLSFCIIYHDQDSWDYWVIFDKTKMGCQLKKREIIIPIRLAWQNMWIFWLNLEDLMI